jgi:hypothetical protein
VVENADVYGSTAKTSGVWYWDRVEPEPTLDVAETVARVSTDKDMLKAKGSLWLGFI